MADWAAQHRRWSPLAWRADLLGIRLAAWITHWEHFFGREPSDEVRPILVSLARQARHLARVASWEAAGAARFAALKGLVLARLALGARERQVLRVLDRLAAEIAAQIRPDGGTVERSPRLHLAILRDLVEIRSALKAAHQMVPETLQGAIDRMSPMLRFFRHGDGRLAHFNDSAEELGGIVDLTLARAEAKGKPPASAPHSGFQRLQAGRSLVLADTGAPPPRGLDADAHAGTLAFEMSHGRDRLIVNCGAYQGANAEWRLAARSTAAHSTLVVADTNSSVVLAESGLGERVRNVTCERAEDEGSQWIATTHDGYLRSFGLTHARQLFLSADGEDLRGEDTLTGRPGASFVIRFHLHPAVQVSLTQDGNAALLRLPSGLGWRLRAQGAQMSLADSVYLTREQQRKTQQIVLSGHVGTHGASVRWAIRREGKRAAEKPAEHAALATE
jgi:uncharacterized heparinase superfamily protein